jgi:hypothetical protein
MSSREPEEGYFWLKFPPSFSMLTLREEVPESVVFKGMERPFGAR